MHDVAAGEPQREVPLFAEAGLADRLPPDIAHLHDERARASPTGR
jgi:hypothetical protein